MARLLSLNFSFHNQEHLALISIREKGHDLWCQVRYVDKQLCGLLSGQQFVFSLLEGLKQPAKIEDKKVEALLLSTVDALRFYLESQSVNE